MSDSCSFEERAQQVLARRGRGELLIGPDERLVLPATNFGVRRKPSQAGQGSIVVRLLAVFAIGALSATLGHYALFLTMDGRPDAALDPSALGLVTGGGLVLGLLGIRIFRMKGMACQAMLGLAVVAATCTFHNLFHWMPGPTAMVFSPDHVAQMQQLAPANSIRLYGMLIALGATPSETALLQLPIAGQSACDPVVLMTEGKTAEGARWLAAPKRQNCE